MFVVTVEVCQMITTSNMDDFIMIDYKVGKELQQQQRKKISAAVNTCYCIYLASHSL